ncbi:MAG: serine/threonine protein phosphatase [Clostridiales bacterium]|nr:serine/threonine protein phosphatase [Clostridiales bacterium]
MALFALADLHLSLSADKPMDVFKGWDNYVERIAENWKKIVTDQDTVVLPGDLSWAMKLEDSAADFAYIDALPGQKLLLKGNHDLWWCTMRKMETFFAQKGFTTLRFVHNNAVPVEEYCVCGTRGWFFDDDSGDKKVLLREAGRLETSIAAAEQTGLEPVVFLHYPPVCGGQVCEEIFSVLTKHHIQRVYYGHIHGPGAYRAINGMYEGILFRLVSCDFANFTPVLVR